MFPALFVLVQGELGGQQAPDEPHREPDRPEGTTGRRLPVPARNDSIER